MSCCEDDEAVVEVSFFDGEDGGACDKEGFEGVPVFGGLGVPDGDGDCAERDEPEDF